MKANATAPASLRYIIYLTCLFTVSCATTSEIRINRPRQVIDEAAINVQKNLKLSRGQVRYFSSIEHDEYTQLILTTDVTIVDYYKNALFQELYRLDGYSIPPNPPFYQEKKTGKLLLNSLMSSGLALHYSIRDYAGYGLNTASAAYLPIVFGVGEIVAIATYILQVFGTAPDDSQTAPIEKVLGLVSALAAYKMSAVIYGSIYIRRHRIGLESGYNFDDSFDVTQFFDVPIEWKPGVLSGMSSDQARFILRTSEMREQTFAVFAIDAGDSEESNALRDFVTNALIESGFTKVVDRRSIERAIETSSFGSGDGRNDESIREIVKTVEADYAIVGSLTTLGETYYLNLRLLSAKTGENVASSVTPARGREEFVDMSKSAIETLLRIE